MTRQRKSWNLILVAASSGVIGTGLYLSPGPAAYAVAAAWAVLATGLLVQTVRG